MKCPKCQHENAPSSNFCSKCGTKLQGLCPQCKAEVAPEDRFCSKCGADLKGGGRKAEGGRIEGEGRRAKGEDVVSLPKLEEMLSRLFIPQPLKEKMEAAQQQIEGENRVVTVMFADISGFTPASEQLSPEQLTELANDCFKAIVNSIVKYEGSINRFIGDSVLSFFGAPITHENDSERAILAALDIVQAMQKLNRQVTIGINTGMVYIGPVGAEVHQEYTVEGYAANLAKRLQETAKPGEIIVGEGTYRHTRRAFEFESLPPLTLKGISKPVSAYKVLKALPKPEKVRGIEGLKAELIGRDEEFAKLKEAYAEILRGRGQMASIIGEAGVGKSRLVAELRKVELETDGEGGRKAGEAGEAGEARDKGSFPPASLASPAPHPVLWLEGRCLELGMTASYWPFIDIFRDYFAWRPEDDDRKRAESIISSLREMVNQGHLSEERFEEMGPLLGNLLSVRFGNDWDNRLKNASPEQIKHQTFLTIHDFFVALSKQQPVILVFEDLHWADSLSLDLISLLMEALRLGPIFLLCVYRPEKEHKCWHLATIASQKCPERYTEIHLRELNPNQSRRLVESLLNIENLPSSVKEMILEKSRGNPFFVEEVVRSLIYSGMVYREGEVWKAKAGIESVTVPESIQSVILSRVDRLEQDSKHVLESASVIGRLFRRRLLGYVTQQEAELERALWELEDHELIYQERVIPEEEYSFKHVLTQETVYQSLLQRRRAVFHQKVAEAIEFLYQDGLDEYYEQLAYHYDKSGIVEKAIEYLLKAGEKARRAYLNDEAIGYFKRALERLDGIVGATHASPLQQEWRLSALKGLGQIYHGVGKESEAEEFFREAIALGKEMGLSARELVRLYFWLGDVFWWQSRYDEKIRIGEEGLTLLGDDTESVEAALMNQSISSSYMARGNREEHREFSYRNVQFIQRLPYSEELRPAYDSIVVMYAYTKNVEEAKKWLQVFEQMARQHHDLRALGEMHSHMGHFILSPIGDLRGAISREQQALEIFTKIGDDKHRSRYSGWIAETFLSLGDLQKSEEYARRALEIMEAIGNKFKFGIAWSYITIGTISLCQEPALNEVKGHWEKATESFQKAIQLSREIGYWQETRATLSLGQAYLAQGKQQEALRQFQEAIALAKTDSVNLANALSGLEEAYDDPEAFRAYCRDFVGAIHELPLQLVQWYLEPAEIHEFSQNLFHDDFVRAQQAAPLHPWTWHDQFGDCAFKVENGLEIQAANGRDLWHINLSAPRILQPVSGDFATQTVCAPVVRAGFKPAPTIGGILLWKDKENYLRLDKGTRGKYEISFSGCIGNKDVIIGRGRLPINQSRGAGEQRSRGEEKDKDMERVFLRMERLGSQVNALCSADGEEWFTVGHVEFPVDDPVEVGLHAIGNIDRTIYHGAFPEGTAIRFESFQLWST